MKAFLDGVTYTVTRDADGTLHSTPPVLIQALSALVEMGVELDFGPGAGMQRLRMDIPSLRTYVRRCAGTISEDEYVTPPEEGVVN
jgi:hypothetical protein